MGKAAARVKDKHSCPLVNVLVPHVGGPILAPAAVTVLTGKLAQARVGDKATCVGPSDAIEKGSMTVYVCGQQAARMGDPTVHGGVIDTGEPTVLIGDASSGGGGAPGMVSQLPIALEGGDVMAQAMAKAMIAAAREGKPFCEQCTRAALEASMRQG